MTWCVGLFLRLSRRRHECSLVFVILNGGLIFATHRPGSLKTREIRNVATDLTLYAQVNNLDRNESHFSLLARTTLTAKAREEYWGFLTGQACDMDCSERTSQSVYVRVL